MNHVSSSPRTATSNGGLLIGAASAASASCSTASIPMADDDPSAVINDEDEEEEEGNSFAASEATPEVVRRRHRRLLRGLSDFESMDSLPGSSSIASSRRSREEDVDCDVEDVNGEEEDMLSRLMRLKTRCGGEEEEEEALTAEEAEEKAKLISQVLELQNTLDDLTSRVDTVKEENLRLRSENSVLGQYIESLMQASAVFQAVTQEREQSDKSGRNASASKGLGSVIRSCAARTKSGSGKAEQRIAAAAAKVVDDDDEDDDDSDVEDELGRRKPVVKGVFS